MTSNPFIALFEHPVDTLAAGAYTLILLGLLILSWWALGRNALYLYDNWRDGWLVLVPWRYAWRLAAGLGLVAVDLLLVGGIIYVLT